MTDHVQLNEDGSALAFVGPKAVNIYRMMTLAHGLRGEIQGMRLTRGRTCYSIIKEEFGLRGRKQRVLDQFLPLLAEAKAAIEVRRDEPAEV